MNYFKRFTPRGGNDPRRRGPETERALPQGYTAASFQETQAADPEKYLDMAAHLRWKAAKLETVTLYGEFSSRLYAGVADFADLIGPDDAESALVQSWIMLDVGEHELERGFPDRWNGMPPEEKRSLARGMNEGYSAFRLETLSPDHFVPLIISWSRGSPNTFRSPAEIMARENRPPNEDQQRLNRMLSPFREAPGIEIALCGGFYHYCWAGVTDHRILIAEYCEGD